MTKKNSLSIVTAWSWFCNVTDLNILTASEQLILIHLMKFINRNFWRPIKIEPVILAKSTNKDTRTVKKALTSLINKGFITESQGGYFIGLNNITTENEQRGENGDNSANNSSNARIYDFAE